MKFEVKSKNNESIRVGIHCFETPKGKTEKLTASEAEIALSTGKYEFIREVPENKAEKEKVKAGTSNSQTQPDEAGTSNSQTQPDEAGSTDTQGEQQ